MVVKRHPDTVRENRKILGMVMEGKSICELGVSRRKKLLEVQITELEIESKIIDLGRGS